MLRICPKVLCYLILVSLALLAMVFPSRVEAGIFQETFRISAHTSAVEGDYVYIVGEAVNLAGELHDGDLDLSGGMRDIWLVKLRKDGTPVFTALIGGADDDAAYSLAVREGVVYILGETWSRDFPGAPGNAGENDALLLALAADGSEVLWARRIGGSDQDAGRALTFHDGALYLTGITWSDDLVQDGDLGDADGFLGRVLLDGRLDWLQIFGGRGLDAPYDITVVNEKIWIGGQSFSRDFSGIHQGEGDAFAARFSLGGEQQFTGMYGGREADISFAISPDDDGGILIAGGTRTGSMPEAVGEYTENYDGFLMALDSDGNVQWTSYFGGTNVEYAYDIERLPGGEVFVVGETYSPSFPLAFDQPQDAIGGGDAFIVQIDSGGEIICSLLKGGPGGDYARDAHLTSSGLWLAGKFDVGDLSYGLLVLPSELGLIDLPTDEPNIPTATLALTATPQPTETSLPTSTPTPQPTTPQTATAAAVNTATAAVEGTAVSEVQDRTPTSTAAVGDEVPVEETQPAGILPGEPEELTPTPATSGEGQSADEEVVRENNLPTGLLIGGGLLLAAGFASAYYWYRHKHEKNSSES